MEKTINLNEVLNVSTNFVENNEREQSIYVAEIFAGKTFQEKKKIRVKLRRKLENIITAWNICVKTNKIEKLDEIFAAWNDFKVIYKNEQKIYSGYKSDYAEMCKAFLNAYAEYMAKQNAKQKQKTPKKETTKKEKQTTPQNNIDIQNIPETK